MLEPARPTKAPHQTAGGSTSPDHPRRCSTPTSATSCVDATFLEHLA
jgi:hypothetical protein